MERHLRGIFYIRCIKSALRCLFLKTFPKPLTAEDEKYYLQRHEEGDKKARQILIEYNLRLVAHIAKKYQTTEDDMEELISIGTVGLIKAVDTFDHEKASKLATYAARCVEKPILSLMRFYVLKRFHIPVDDLLDDYNRFQYKGQGELLRECREKMGLKKKPFARLLHVHPNTYRDWEADKKRMFKITWNKYFRDIVDL